MSYDDPTRILIPWPTEQGPLPHDCLMCICEYLEPKDLIRFALACRVRARSVRLVLSFKCLVNSRNSIMWPVPVHYGGVLNTCVLNVYACVVMHVMVWRTCYLWCDSRQLVDTARRDGCRTTSNDLRYCIGE